MFFSKKISIFWYVIADFVGAITTWLLFYYIRKELLNEPINITNWLNDQTFFKGIISVVFFWIALNYLSGAYHSLYKKSRLTDAAHLFLITLLGSIFIFFIFILNDKTENYSYYLKALLLIFCLQFFITLILRSIVLNIVKRQIIKNQFYYTSIVIGNKNEIENVVQSRLKESNWNAYKIIGYYSNDNFNIPNLIQLGDINSVSYTNNKYDEVIVAFNSNNTHFIKNIISNFLGKKISIKMLPTEQDMFVGAVHTNNVFGSNLIEIKNVAMPEWQQNFKKLIDFVLAIVCVIFLSPLIIFVYILTKLSTKKAIFRQERIGYHSKPFILYKFTSMKNDAEKNGPQLSSDNDNRVTKWGKKMRKWRLDELPQFYNILKGEMSFVGPRPEREFYVKQLIEKNSYYKLLHELKPGLTSMGMVKYGYAENVDQMLERMQYDIMYANNASLLLDLKIMFHTLRILFLGTGK